METLESIAAARAAGRQIPILPPDAPLEHLPAVRLDAGSAQKLRLGQAVAAVGREYRGRVRLYGADGIFMGLGESDEYGSVRPKRLLAL